MPRVQQAPQLLTDPLRWQQDRPMFSVADKALTDCTLLALRISRSAISLSFELNADMTAVSASRCRVHRAPEQQFPAAQHPPSVLLSKKKKEDISSQGLTAII